MNLDIYNKLREFHNTINIMLYGSEHVLNKEEANALETLHSLLYMVEKEFGTENKEPDYEAMAERKQFGKFWNKDGDIDDQEYGVLTKINSDYVTYPFIIREDVSYKHFTPMAEPKEIEL